MSKKTYSLEKKNQIYEADACDPISAFGGIVSCNFKITKTRRYINNSFAIVNQRQLLELLKLPIHLRHKDVPFQFLSLQLTSDLTFRPRLQLCKAWEVYV